jgi:hypothetical protein
MDDITVATCQMTYAELGKVRGLRRARVLWLQPTRLPAAAGQGVGLRQPLARGRAGLGGAISTRHGLTWAGGD